MRWERGRRAARSRGRRAGDRHAHAPGRAAGEGRPSAAGVVRADRHGGRPGAHAASCGPATPRRPTRRCASRFATRRWLPPDEIGWRVGAVRHWLWAFATPDTTVYAICPGRGFDDAVTVLDADFRRCARARRVGAVSSLRPRVAPNLPDPLAPALQAPSRRPSTQSLGRSGGSCPPGRARVARSTAPTAA